MSCFCERFGTLTASAQAFVARTHFPSAEMSHLSTPASLKLAARKPPLVFLLQNIWLFGWTGATHFRTRLSSRVFHRSGGTFGLRSLLADRDPNPHGTHTHSG